MTPDQNGADAPVARLQSRTAAILQRSTDAVIAGGFLSFLFLLFVGGAVMVFLFATVHHQKPAAISAKVPPRYEELITFWHERGYFRHGGLWIRSGPQGFSAPKPGEKVRWAYRTASMGYLQLGHVIERPHLWMTGRYSQLLMSIHNQALIWFSAALLGWLAMRVVLRLGGRSLHALLPGIAVLVVFQTFPPNLAYYWETSSTSALSIFAFGFLLTAEPLLLDRPSPRRMHLLRGLTVFGMFYIDAYIGLFFVGMYILAGTVLGYPVVRGQRIAATIIAPAALAIALFMAQILWVKLTIPGLQFVGHLTRDGILFRTGFDGSVQIVGGHADILGFNRFNSSLKWVSLFIAGVASLAVLLALHHKVPQLKFPMFILVAAAGLYIPFAFVFSQGVAIHPYFYDTYLVIPLILSLFAVLPATIEKLTGNRGIFILVFFLMAVCYSMVSLRQYAMDYPV